MNDSSLIESRPEPAPLPTDRAGLASGGGNREVILDVRDDIRHGREPFSKIMATVSALGSDQQLRLIAPFEPVPLFGVLEKAGFQNSAQPLGSGDWEVVFTRRPASATGERIPSVSGQVTKEKRAATVSGQIVDLDVRGLEPPQPLVTILEALAALPADSAMQARTDRRPMHLYPQLEDRGFIADTQEQPDGSFLTHIRRR